ncbi:MAG: hypothetical protein ACFE9D_00960 [Promethearchaeota archaeon]
MEPSTLLPLEGISEGYGLRDDALDQMLMTTGYREVTLQYRAAVKHIQDVFCTDIRLRIVSMSYDDEEEDPLWPHMAWMPLWSNRDTCVLVADPLKPPSHHDSNYLLPLGFAQFFAHAQEEYPYYMPLSTPDMLLPQYLECQLIRLTPMMALNPQIPHESEDSEPTIFSLVLETIFRLRAFLGDQVLIERGFTTGVAYQHTSLLYELPLPAYPEVIETRWSLPFLLMDAARAILTLGQTDYLTFTGLQNLTNHARNRLNELDLLVGNVSPNPTFVSLFDNIRHHFTGLHKSYLRDPSETNVFVYELLEKAEIFQQEEG